MKRVLITGVRAPVALHLARLFDADGWKVIMADTLNAPLGRSSATCSNYVKLPAPDRYPDEFRDALRNILDLHKPYLVIPTCEEVFYLAWAFESLGIEDMLFAPPLAALRRAHNKASFADDARNFGLNPPRTFLIENRTDAYALRAQSRQLVFKPIWSRFASQVLICPNPDQVDDIAPSPTAAWIAQEFIPGEELCCYAVAREGRLVCCSAYRPTYRAGRGAGIYFEPVIDDQITGDCATYVAKTGWTGQISFDFRRDENGRLRVLECNPRATSGVHFLGQETGLIDAIVKGTFSEPTARGPMMLPAAMAIYGLPVALRRLGLVKWWCDLVKADDVLNWPNDPLPILAQPRAVIELIGIAVKTRTSLLSASTTGIAWDGNAIGPAAATTRAR
jgi:glutathione synthase/RimK-type ligase-like ATP-grasp enzyme